MPKYVKKSPMIRAHNISELRKLLIEELDIKKFVRSLIKMALGGKKLKNGNGVSYKALPNLDASKLILQYLYGPPVAEQSEINTNLSKISEVLSELMLPKKQTISADGRLVDNMSTPFTVNSENA